MYLGYNLLMSLIASTYAVIILFNVAKPQTKRSSLVEDLTSQAKGTVALCFAKLIFWILAAITYTHRQAGTKMVSIKESLFIFSLEFVGQRYDRSILLLHHCPRMVRRFGLLFHRPLVAEVQIW